MTEAAGGDAESSRAPNEPVSDLAWLGLPLDAHLHTDLSHDSDVPLDVYPALAREQGVDEIAITDHLDFDPRLPNHRLADFHRRERLVRELAERWDGRPHVRFGVEITYGSAHEEEIRSYLASHRYDYVIGSVHIGPDDPLRTPDSAARWCAGRALGEAAAPYFAEVERAAASGLFDTLGHLDFVKRYLFPHLGLLRYRDEPERYDRVLRMLVDSGTALEVNSSGGRQQSGVPYPEPDVVARFRELGGERVVAGSDSHRADSFGLGMRDAYDAIARAGFESLAFRRGSERVAIGLGAVRSGSAGPGAAPEVPAA